jgi:hypothetical protein
VRNGARNGWSAERRFTHCGILAALIDLAADWALVRQTGRGVPTIDMRVDYPKAPRPAITSAFGKKRTFRPTESMSAFGRIADIAFTNYDVDHCD